MSGNNNNAKKPQPTTATSDFICTLKFSNNLPDLPFEPKLLTVPLDPLRLYKFQPENSLERDYKHSIIPEADLGIPLNLVDPHTFQCSPQLKAKGLQKRDQQLLTEEFKENKIDHSSIPWLRKTEYMTNDFSQETLYGRTGAKAKPAVDIQFKYTAKSIEEQVKTIEDSFEASKRLPVHPTKPGLTPVNITPFFPDHEHWRSRYSQVIFDQDPGDVIDKNSEHYEVKKQEQNDLSSCGLISALKTSKQEDYAIYLVPSLDDYSDITNFKAFSEEQREYKFVREYTFNIINDNKSKREIFIIFDEDNQTASYNIIESKVELKRRVKAEDDEETFASSFSSSDTTVKLTKVDNEYAHEIAETRMSHLKPVVIVDEDAMIEDEPTNDNSNARVHSPTNEEESEEEDEDVDIFGDE